MSLLPDRLVVGVGETRTVTLPGYSSAGYRWHASAEPSTGVVHVSVVVAEEPVRAAASRPELLSVRGEAPGAAVVEIALQRSWEPDPVERHTMHVTVTLDANHDGANADARRV